MTTTLEIKLTMNAKDAVEKYGERLVGLTIMTEKIGWYPGGWAKVVGINPDPEEGIVIQVKHLTWLGEEFDDAPGYMGIFEHEDIGFAEEPKP